MATGVTQKQVTADLSEDAMGLVDADADGLPCYLETTNPENLPFYRRHGFEVAADGQVPKSELHVWAMVRR